MMESPLLGICLVGEVETSDTNVIGTVYLPSPARVQTLVDFRKTLYSALPPIVNSKQYVFLTTNGWEIDETLEGTVNVSDIVSTDGGSLF